MHAKDGEIYDFNGKSVIVIGGTYSVLAPSGMSITSTSGGIYFCEKQTIHRAGIYFSKLELGFPSQRWKIKQPLSNEEGRHPERG